MASDAPLKPLRRAARQVQQVIGRLEIAERHLKSGRTERALLAVTHAVALADMAAAAIAAARKEMG